MMDPDGSIVGIEGDGSLFCSQPPIELSLSDVPIWLLDMNLKLSPGKGEQKGGGPCLNRQRILVLNGCVGGLDHLLEVQF
jgi:hypothetical protein